MNTISLWEMEPSWKAALLSEWEKPYLQSLALFLAKEKAFGYKIYPPTSLMLNAFWKTPFEKVRVVIVGQDPYHGEGQAHGLCFSVPEGIPPPPSLVNIFKELEADLGIPIPKQGCLNAWANQGVFLLNTLLSVREGEPLSHQSKGWELFTDAALKAIAEKNNPVVFILWGKAAQEKCKEVLKNNTRHLILKATHPSPLSAYQGFFGSKPFSQTNAFLKNLGQEPIQWSL